MSDNIIQNNEKTCNARKKLHSIHRCAISLARAGIRLHPLPEGKKAAPITSWRTLATTDLATIKEWFEEGRHNIGVITGEQVDVVDFDHNETYEQVAEKLQEYFTVKTRRGYHVYVAPTGLKNKVGKGKNKDIDLRGEGGYVVGPRSIIKDGDDIREYLPMPFCTMEMLTNPKPAPEWLLDILTKDDRKPEPEKRPLPSSSASSTHSSTGNQDYVNKTLKALVDEIASAGKGFRNHTLNRCALRGYRVAMAIENGVNMATDLFTAAAEQAGLRAFEINGTLASAREKAEEDGVALPAPTPEPAPKKNKVVTPSFGPNDLDPTPMNTAVFTVSTSAPEPEKEQEGPADFKQILADLADDKGKIKFSMATAAALLKAYGVVYDTFWGDYFVNDKVFDNTEKAKFMIACAEGGLDYPIGKQYINQPLWSIEGKRDWLIEQVEALPEWDGQQRISWFFEKYCGAERSNFNIYASMYLWTSLVGRMLATKKNPCKADIVIILQGAQGSRKTTLTHALCLKPELWSSFNFDMKEDEIKRRIRTSCVVEVPELTGFSRKDMTNIKQFFGESVDQYRQLYQEQTTTTARRCVFIMTTNELEFLRDSTGERRFAPVKVGRIDIEAVERDLPQLYAEALVIFKRNNQGVMWQELEEFQAEHNEEFKEENPLEDAINDWLRLHPEVERIRTIDIVTDALRENPAKANLYKKSISAVMRKLGYETVQKRSGNGVRTRAWELIQ